MLESLEQCLGLATTGVGLRGPFIDSNTRLHCSSPIQQITSKKISIAFYTILDKIWLPIKEQCCHSILAMAYYR